MRPRDLGFEKSDWRGRIEKPNVRRLKVPEISCLISRSYTDLTESVVLSVNWDQTNYGGGFWRVAARWNGEAGVQTEGLGAVVRMEKGVWLN